MRLSRVAQATVLPVLAIAATACTKVAPTTQSSLSLSGTRPTLTAGVVTPVDAVAGGTQQAAGDSAFSSPLALSLSTEGEAEVAAESVAAPTVAVVVPTPTPEPVYQTYTVVWADTLLDIAMRYGVDMGELARINGIENNSIYIGQVLKIPAKAIPAGAQQYTVQSGDSLYSIALAAGVTLEDLMAANNLTNGYYLAVGQVLVIPTSQAGAVAESGASSLGTSVQAASLGTQSYTVQPGDTLSSIAAYFGVAASDIATANSLANPDVLEVGQELIIP